MKTRNKVEQSKLRLTLIAIACMFVFLVVMFSLKSYPYFIERYYSNGVYILIRKGFQFLFNYVPFSVGDVLYIIIIILLVTGLFQLVRLLIRKQLADAGFLFLRFILKLEIAIAAFYILWALNYFRQPAIERLELQDYAYDVTQLVTVTSMLIDSANVSRLSLRSRDFNPSHQEILDPAIQAVSRLSFFDPSLIAIKPMAKKSLLSPLLNYIGTAGYYNPYTGEAQFNSLMPVFTQSFVACHEMAHQMGFGAEDEANFAGFIAGKSSDNKLLKYSAYYLAAQEFMNEVWRTDSTAFRQMKERISPAVIKDLETERQYWTKYQGGAARLSSILYDNYLKANKQPGGLKTYNRMIKLSMAYYRKKGLLRRASSQGQ
ncbi:DUF3810 domain-containing protein [Daejeonella sp.]|uniref:DUF3810 domain-containing protein n=1 Tax=Daejeonella sp. TaxID=2805397 RepID=UPI0030C50AF9